MVVGGVYFNLKPEAVHTHHVTFDINDFSSPKNIKWSQQRPAKPSFQLEFFEALKTKYLVLIQRSPTTTNESSSKFN
jgi:hypothetical protein